MMGYDAGRDSCVSGSPVTPAVLPPVLFGDRMSQLVNCAVELMTFEELERLPDEPGKTELLDGELIQMPPAKRLDHILAEELFLRLHQMVESLNAGSADLALGEVHFGVGYKIGRRPDSWLIPDVSVTHRDQPARSIAKAPR
jgi:Uma2 family endonuclease